MAILDELSLRKGLDRTRLTAADEARAHCVDFQTSLREPDDLVLLTLRIQIGVYPHRRPRPRPVYLVVNVDRSLCLLHGFCPIAG
ncbi:MAG: hypothetical protein ABSG18_02295, partial [Steroidobacteraceae bacterium]